MDVKKALINIFEENGIFLNEDDCDTELQLDSIQFVNLIVQIEETFTITVNEEYMLQERLPTFHAVLDMVEEAIRL